MMDREAWSATVHVVKELDAIELGPWYDELFQLPGHE